uniref:DH domain-containing protein n=1 Tax=Kalmanozyma brasiliensis (strain GHG001) TaxID=1365824 RepID=V5EU73_KALBG
MTASQLTPRANTASLLPEKSLPPSRLPSSSATTLYSAYTLKALPARPAVQRSHTEFASTSSEPVQDSLVHSQAAHSRSSGNIPASFLDFDFDTPKRPFFAPSATSDFPAIDTTPKRQASVSSASIGASPSQAFYSPRWPPQSPRTNQQFAQTSPMPSGQRSSSSRRAPRPSLPSHWKTGMELNNDAPAMPPCLSLSDAISSPKPSAALDSAHQQDHSGQSSPASRRLSSHHSHFSPDYSLRGSSSTHTSLWTERSLPSCETSPTCAQFHPASEAVLTDADSKVTETAELAEELDEDSVGLGITSDLGLDVSSRRSSAAPVMPSPMLPGSARALQGPFSHHRAPSWTRRMDASPLAGLPPQHQVGGHADSLIAPAEAGLRSLGLNVMPSMQRAMSDVTPVAAANEMIAAAVASASPLAKPSIPLRRDSRTRCSSDSANYLPAAVSATQHSQTLSSSISSPTCSSVLTPTSGEIGGRNLPELQSPPRTSSLRQSPSMGSLRTSPFTDSSPRTSPYRPPALANNRPSRPSLQRISTIDDLNTTIDDLSDSVDAFQQAAEGGPRRDSPSRISLRTSSAASRARRVSDVSINSFLHNAEFSHIVGAYTSKMRWEEGLYDFDESVETDVDESKAVKTAEEGSATIVEGRDLTMAQIEAETGPNTTHLLLGGNRAEGLVEVLERALPLACNLLVLDLSNCALQRLPDAIGACVALEELDLSGNPVGDLPDWMLNLRALRTLSVDSTGLQHLPSSLIQLQELQRLSLRNNQLLFLPSWLHRMSKLNYLFVEGNRFAGPWQGIVAPLLSPAHQTTTNPLLAAQAHLANDEPFEPRQSGLLDQPLPARPFMARMRSANDLQNMLRGHFGSPTPPVSTPDSQDDDSGYIRPQEVSSRPATGYEDQVIEHANVEVVGRRLSNGGKWGGFLKKIGRKASSQRLASMYQEPSPTQASFPSPRAARKSLRLAASARRTNSIVSKSAAAPLMVASQSEPVPSSIALASHSLSAAMDGDSNTDHLAVAFDLPSGPATPSESAALLQPFVSDAEAKKNRRRTFLPVHAFAVPAPTGLTGDDDADDSVHPASPMEMDEESLHQHRTRLRALMHYLRDLDDLAAARTEAASFVGPSKNNLAQLRDTGSHSRTPSMHRAESSNPSTKSRDSSGDYVASTAASSVSETATCDSARMSTAHCTKDDSIRRFRIIAEIVSTERTYVKGLSELVDIYVKPAMAPADGNSGVPVVPPTEHRSVFGNVEALLRFHRTVFLPSLIAVTSPVLEHDQDAPGEMSAQETAAVAENVASVFSKHAAFFKMYSSYINNCDSAQERIHAWMVPSSATHGGGLTLRGPGYGALQALGAMSAHHGTAAAAFAHGFTPAMMAAGPGSGIFGNDGHLSPLQRKKIKTFMQRCRTHPRHAQLNVESYLLLPVQRIPRYRLLLEDLVKSTDTARLTDADALAAALEHVTQIASKVNESKRQSEQDRRLLGWQYRIRGSIGEPLVQPHRRLLKDGSLQLKRVVRRVPGFVRSSRSASVGGAGPQRNSSMLSPSGLPGQSHILSADHLQQVTEDQRMSMILCSDVAVLCTEQTRSKDPSAPVLLRSMLKLVRPVEILGGVNLRIVDGAEILYLQASSAEDAVAWKTAFDLHFYQ